MNILILGNSQIGALKVGFDNYFANSDLDIECTFLGIPQQGFDEFRLENKKLNLHKRFWGLINSSSTQIAFPLDLSAYDRIILVAGLSYLSPHLLYTLNPLSVRSFSVPLLKASIMSPPNKWSHVVNTSSICIDLMNVFLGKVIFLGNALPSPDLPLVKSLTSLPKDQQQLIKMNSRRIRDIVATMNQSDSFYTLLPPEHILCENQISLKLCFYDNGLRLNGEINGDHFHPNAQYGAIILGQIFNVLQL